MDQIVEKEKLSLNDVLQAVNVQAQIIEEGSKLAFAYNSHNKKKYEKLISKDDGFTETLEKFKLPLAVVGDKKQIIYGEKGELQFTAEDTQKIKDKAKELLRKSLEEDFVFFKVDFNLLTEKEKEKFSIAILTGEDKVYSIDESKIDEEEYTIISRFIDNLPEFPKQ